MEQKNFIEALCASSNGVVVERRKSIIIPLVTLLVGVAILVANYFIENGSDANNLKSALLFKIYNVENLPEDSPSISTN